MKSGYNIVFVLLLIFLVTNNLLISLELHDYVDMCLANKPIGTVLNVDDYRHVFSESIQADESKMADDGLWYAKRIERGCDISVLEFSSSISLDFAYRCPFIQKQAMPKKCTICFIGDLHACYMSLALLFKRMIDGDGDGHGKILNPDLSIIDPATVIVFLGDYCGRGPSSLDTLFLLALFKLKNRENVFLLRGNHESLLMDSMDTGSGLQAELISRFGQTRAEAKLLKLALRMFEYMPIALFLKCSNSYIQCCHGGIDEKFYPMQFLLNNAVFFDSLGEVLSEKWIGLLWNDFCSGRSFCCIPWVNWDRGCGCIYDVSTTHRYLDELNQVLTSLESLLSLKLIVRAHQHGFYPFKMVVTDEYSDIDGGLKYWKEVVGGKPFFKVADYEPVLTLSSAPICGLACKYSYCVLAVDGEYSNWILTPVEG